MGSQPGWWAGLGLGCSDRRMSRLSRMGETEGRTRAGSVTTQLEREGSRDKLKLSNFSGGGLFSISSTPWLQACSVSVSESESDWESRARPEPGVAPSSRELEEVEGGWRECGGEEEGGGRGEMICSGGTETGIFPDSGRVQTMM